MAHPISQRDWYAMVASKEAIAIAKSFDSSLTETDCRYIVADSRIKTGAKRK